MKIAITGGHLTPALAFIEYAQTQGDDTFVFFGRLLSQTTDTQQAREKIEVEKHQVPFVGIDVPRFANRNPLSLFLDGIRYLVVLVRTLGLVAQHRPTILLSFGGYVAVPVAIACWLLGVPVITHEQTVVGGSANQLIAKLAKKVALSFAQSKKYFPKHKTTVTGNPIRFGVIDQHAPMPSWILKMPTKPLIYITGGNQGSYFINNTIAQLVPQLTRKYTVVITCGKSTNQMNYKKELQKQRRTLMPSQQNSFYIKEWIDEQDLAWVLTHASIAVSRSGANTVQELIAHQVPSIFIPLPFAKHDEQLRNAQIVAKTGGALVLQQNAITPRLLLENINQMMKTQKAHQKKMAKITVPTDGAARLFKLVHSL